jgi:hypothetical protein
MTELSSLKQSLEMVVRLIRTLRAEHLRLLGGLIPLGGGGELHVSRCAEILGRTSVDQFGALLSVRLHAMSL